MQKDLNEFIWAQKYRPKTIDDCIITDDMKTLMKSVIEKSDLPSFLFYGSPGLGKTTLAKVLPQEIDADYMFINGSKENSIDNIRNRVAEYASSVSLNGKRKYVILDEIDGMSSEAQKALKSFMEDVSSNCGFIMTSNHINKVDPAIQSRATKISFSFKAEEKNALMKSAIQRMLHILKAENIPVDKTTAEIVTSLVKTNFPDFRTILNTLQKYTVSGKIDTGVLVKIDQKIEKLVEHLANKEYTKMVEWVLSNAELDFPNLITALYKELSVKFVGPKLPFMIIILNKYDYQHSFVANRDINTISMLCELMMEIKD